MNPKEQMQELAALHAAGALDGEDASEFKKLLAAGDPVLLSELKGFARVSDSLAKASDPAKPSLSLRTRLVETIGKKIGPPGASVGTETPGKSVPGHGFSFIKNNDAEGWIPLAIQGSYVKPLQVEVERGYALVLGKLDPGAEYPAHAHFGPEQIYMLSGDLHVGDIVLGPGDFHRAAPSSQHGVNHSVNGCTILLVLSVEDLQSQLELKPCTTG